MQKFFKTFLIPLLVALFIANGFVYADSVYLPPSTAAGYVVIGANDYALVSSSAIFVSPAATVGIGTTTPYGTLNIASTWPEFTLTQTNAATDKKHITFLNSAGNLWIYSKNDALDEESDLLEITNSGNMILQDGTFQLLQMAGGGAHYLATDGQGVIVAATTPLINNPTGTTTITNLLVTGTGDISNLIMGPITFPSDSTTTIPILESTNLWVHATTTIDNSNPNATSTIRGPLELKSADQLHGCYFSYGATSSLICY